MLKEIEDYTIFDDFIAAHLPGGFIDINHKSPEVTIFEEKLAETGQFIYIADLIQLKMLYSSKKCREFFGVDSHIVEPDLYYTRTHPDDLDRHSLGRAKLLRTGYDLYNLQKGTRYLSTNFRIKNAQGKYINILSQCNIFYNDNPVKTSYSLTVHTDVTEIIGNMVGHHFYYGIDRSYFRYPDIKLLMIGNNFTDREIEILSCISEGLDSQQIADKLFLSVHTVNTHRRNILDKTGKRSTLELVIELQEQGFI
jgi:DNA-binding CsgD family transcriptional regulator